MSGELTPRTGNQASHTAPRNVYECSDGGFIALSGSMQSMAERIFDAIGRPELKRDPLLRAPTAARVRNRDVLNRVIGDFIRLRDLKGNLALFEAAGVTVAPVLDMAGILADRYVSERGVITHLPDAELGSIPMHSVVPRLSGTPGGFRRPAPKLGEHSDEILAEIGWPEPQVGAK